MQAANKFHVIEVSFATWEALHSQASCCPLYVTSKLDSSLEGEEVYKNSSNFHFQQDEAHLFNELAEEGEIVSTRPRGVPTDLGGPRGNKLKAQRVCLYVRSSSSTI